MFQRGLSVTRRIHRNPLYDWLMAASVILDASTSATQAEVRYVSKGGNDATGNGSFAKPYLTIAAAVASIADAAAAKPYEVLCAPGVYTDPFTLKPYVFVVGSGKGTAEYASSPLTGLTIITPAANVLSAAFTGAVDGPTGIISCSVAAVLNVDWNAIGSTGQATFLLQNTLHQKTVNFIGLAAGNTAHYPTISNVTTNDLVNINLTNCGGSDIVGELSDFGGPITFTQSAPIQSFHNVSGSFAGIITATWTSALLANNMTIACGGPQTAANPTLTGDGIIFSSPGLFSRKVIADAATSTLAFGTVAATTLVGVIEGSNLLEMTPTANRTLVVRAPPAVGAGAMPTTVIVRNNAAVNSGFNVDFTFGGATLAVGSPTYCPPGKEVSLRWNPGPAQFEVGPYTQSFTGIALGAGTGVSALVPADVLSAHASFVVTRKTVGGTFLTSAADGMVLPADRTVGTRAGGGGFKVSSVFQVGGLLDTGDTSTFDVHLSQ
jgi:hypothetical protein